MHERLLLLRIRMELALHPPICILGFELIFYELLTRPVTSLQGGFERVWDFFLLLFFFAEAYVPLLFACSLVLSAFLVKYRRLAHGFWSFVVSLPLTFVIYVLSSLR